MGSPMLTPGGVFSGTDRGCWYRLIECRLGCVDHVVGGGEEDLRETAARARAPSRARVKTGILCFMDSSRERQLRKFHSVDALGLSRCMERFSLGRLSPAPYDASIGKWCLVMVGFGVFLDFVYQKLMRLPFDRASFDSVSPSTGLRTGLRSGRTAAGVLGLPSTPFLLRRGSGQDFAQDEPVSTRASFDSVSPSTGLMDRTSLRTNGLSGWLPEVDGDAF